MGEGAGMTAKGTGEERVRAGWRPEAVGGNDGPSSTGGVPKRTQRVHVEVRQPEENWVGGDQVRAQGSFWGLQYSPAVLAVLAPNLRLPSCGLGPPNQLQALTSREQRSGGARMTRGSRATRGPAAGPATDPTRGVRQPCQGQRACPWAAVVASTTKGRVHLGRTIGPQSSPCNRLLTFGACMLIRRRAANRALAETAQSCRPVKGACD